MFCFQCSCGEEVVEGGGEEVRAEGAGLAQLRFQRVALPQQRLHPRHDLLLLSVLSHKSQMEVWQALTEQSDDDRHDLFVGFRAQLVAGIDSEMRTGFVGSTDELDKRPLVVQR